jgi:Uncharacterized conserved protein
MARWSITPATRPVSPWPGLKARPGSRSCAYLRHTFTDYDTFLAEGYDRDSARHFVAEDMQALLDAWGVRRRLGMSD